MMSKEFRFLTSLGATSKRLEVLGGAHHLVEDTPTPKAKKKFYDQGCTEKVVRSGARFGGGDIEKNSIFG